MNPLVVALGAELALLIRWSGVALLLRIRRHLRRPRAWLLVGAAASTFAAGTNVLAIWRAVA